MTAFPSSYVLFAVRRHGFQYPSLRVKVRFKSSAGCDDRSNTVPSMSIGQVARICGLAPSAIRYYERAAYFQSLSG